MKPGNKKKSHVLIKKISKRKSEDCSPQETSKRKRGHVNSFSSASESINHLIPAWRERIFKDLKSEELEYKTWNIDHIENSSRAFVWTVCEQLDIETPSVAPTACKVIEKYLSVKTIAASQLIGPDSDRFIEDMAQLFQLRAAISVQLVSKMACRKQYATADMVIEVLKKHGLDYSLSEVKAAEFDVFQTIGFKIPLWSSLEIAQLLCRVSKLPLKLLQAVARTVNLAEMHRPELERMAKPEESVGSAKLATVHLCAGAVVAAARLGFMIKRDLVPVLAEFTNAPECLIRLVADIIISMAISESSEENSDE